MIPVLVAFKKNASIFHSQYQNDTVSEQFKKYCKYFPSAILVSDRFLFLKCICISFRPIFYGSVQGFLHLGFRPIFI